VVVPSAADAADAAAAATWPAEQAGRLACARLVRHLAERRAAGGAVGLA